MKFSLLQLLALFVPSILLTLLISDFLKPDDITWRKFSLIDFKRTQEQNIAAVVLCRPALFWGDNCGQLDGQKLSNESSMSFVAYRHDYRYWTFQGSYDERPPEDKWVLENGGFKEPLLLLVPGNGDIDRMRGSFSSPGATQQIINHLDIACQRRSRTALLICLLVLSLGLMVILSIVGRRK